MNSKNNQIKNKIEDYRFKNDTALRPFFGNSFNVQKLEEIIEGKLKEKIEIKIEGFIEEYIEGFFKGFVEGIIEARKEIAKALKINGYPTAEIAKVTGLTEGEINKI